MDYKGFWMYYRAVIVSIIAAIADMSSMYGLNKIDNLSEPIVLGVSSLVGLFIQFFGQKYWTFKNNTKSQDELVRQVLLFFGLEITIIICVILIYGKIYEPVENKVKELTKGHKKNMITTLSFVFKGKPFYSYECLINYAGATVSWLKDNLRIINSAKETNKVFKEVVNSNGVFVIPAFVAWQELE